MHLARPVALAIAGTTMTTLGLGAALVQADLASAAGKAPVHATIHINGSKSSLQGKVSSTKGACKRAVTVKLHFEHPGRHSFRVVAQDQTSGSGAWSIDAPGTTIPSGHYYVTVAASTRCNAARSKTINVS